MHDHLQSLKVTDLRAILSKAGVRAPARKHHMIAKIQADPDAYKIYTALYPQQPPQDPQPQPKPVLDEAEKRRLRAERFGIPLVPAALDDPNKLAARAARFGAAQNPADGAAAEEEEKRRRRAERFGTNPSDAGVDWEGAEKQISQLGKAGRNIASTVSVKTIPSAVQGQKRKAEVIEKKPTRRGGKKFKRQE
ncbi:hypothetical protein C0993_007685 [Termitomyces sp. T159_Od127]|nr:hypothetical protein C0993_007685 [Termitomyces sp. T159_Od127]